VREAVAKLRHEGLVVSHQGLGVFVASPDQSATLMLNHGSLARPEDYRHLYAVRRFLEGGSAHEAALNHDDGDLAKMAGCIDLMLQASDTGDYVEANIGFHRSAATATKNPFIGLFISFVDTKLKESVALALKSLDYESTVRISTAEHRRILDRIGERDAAGAERAMREHLTNSARRLGL